MKLIFKPSKRKSIMRPVKLKFFNTKSFPARSKKEWKLIDKNPFGDTDKDGVKNFFDCKPLDKNKQGRWAHPIAKSKHQYYNKLRSYHNDPMIVEFPSSHGTLEIYSRSGIKSYDKVKEEKLPEINKERIAQGYDPETIEREAEIFGGKQPFKSKTTNKIIVKPRLDKDSVVVLDKDTGDIRHYEISTKFTKKSLQDQREGEKFYPSIEMEKTLENVKGAKRITDKSDIEIVREEKESRKKYKYDSPAYSDYEEIPFKQMQVEIEDED